MSSLKRAGHDREPRRVSPTLSVREARRPREQPRTFHISNRSIIPSSIPSKGRNRGGTQQTNHRIVLIENGLRERPSSGLRTPDKCLRHDGDTQYRSQDANQTSPAAPRFSPSPAPVTNVSAADLSRDQLSPVWADMLFEHTGRAEFRPQSSQLGISEVNGYSVREGSSANTCGNECPEPPRDHSADEVDLSDGTVYDTYRLTSDPPSVSPTTGTDDDGERLQPQISGSVGRVVIGDEDISLWQTLTNDESESDSYDEEEPDSNDERNPRNDYPDVERGEFQDSSDSDNPLRRRPSRSGKNSLDSDEEDGRMSGDDSDDDAFWR